VSAFTRRIDVRGTDRHGHPLRGVVFDWFVDGEHVGTAATNGQASIEIDSSAAIVAITAQFDGEKMSIRLAPDQTFYTFLFDVSAYPYWREFGMKHFPALVGIAFILLASVLAFAFREPNDLQRHVILAMFALGGGGFGGEIAGFIKADMTLGTKLTISAGGAAAIFVLLYFFIPAGR
jgi:hypothetical protein